MSIATEIQSGNKLTFNLDKLLTTRLLIQANAGGGKSYAIRKLLEETHGKVQQIVLDLEGEFSTLRENYDYILIGKGENVDVQIDIKSAELLAKKLLELKTSAIIDLYELKQHERVIFVKRFLDSMVNAPKSLWHPVIIIVDEAHVFCPESKAGKAESTPAVIDLMTRGRKRGFCGVLATQRISKLNKDAAADCNNKWIGRCSLDIDMKRAADELGFNSKEDMRGLRLLKPGELFCFGPAFTDEVIKIKINKVKTTHLESGQKIGFTPAPPTPKIKSMLSKLSDLPQEAEKEFKEKSDYVKKIRELEQELKVQEKNFMKAAERVPLTQLASIRGAQIQIKQLEARLAPAQKNYQIQKQRADEFQAKAVGGDSIIKPLIPIIQKLIQIDKNIAEHFKRPKIESKPITISDLTKASQEIKKTGADLDKPIMPITPKEPVIFDNPEEEKPLSKCAKLIYGFLLANSDKEFTRTQLGLITGYSYTSGGFQTAIATLNTKSLILKQGDKISINPDNIDDEIEKGKEYSLELIKKRLGKCAGEILDVLLENPSEEYSREEMAMATVTQYSYDSGGFQTAIAKLNVLGLIKKEDGKIKLNPEVEELS